MLEVPPARRSIPERVVPLKALKASRTTVGSRQHLQLAMLPVDAGDGDEDLPSRPRCRAECANVPRPCVFVSCEQNLYLEVTDNGGIRLTWPGLEPSDVAPEASCALDVAEREGELSNEDVAKALNLTRERVRQIIEVAMRKFRARLLRARRLGRL